MGTNEDNGRHTAIGHEPSAFEFRNKLFYFYGYPSSSEKGIDSPDAQGEELRRRYRARLKMEDGLTRLGARIAASSEESRSADDFVVVPDGVVSLAEKPHHPGFLINETRLLKNLPDCDSTIPGPSNASTAPVLITDSIRSTHQAAPIETAAVEIVKAMARPRSVGKRRHGSDTGIDIDSDGNSDHAYFDADADGRRERTEWHRMLSAALSGDVVVSEKKRLNTQSDGYLLNLTDNEYAEHLSDLLQNSDYLAVFKHLHIDLWLGCRAVLRGRTPQQEKQTLESLRTVHTDTALRSVMEFNADRVVSSAGTSDEQPPATQHDFSAQCLLQAQKLLRRLDYVECMYPTLKALGEAKPIYASKGFQSRLAAITSWTNISVRLGMLHTMLQRWTGSQDLNLYSTSTPEKYESTTIGITGSAADAPRTPGQSYDSASHLTSRQHSLSSASRKGFKHTPFVEQLLKENGLKKIFDQSILTEVEAVMKSAKEDMIANAGMFFDIGLPVTSRHMQKLLLFAPRLLQACLQIRLESAENLVNPAPAQVDQLIEDIQDSLAAACRVKRSFIELVAPIDKWNPGVELDSQYDHILLSCLQTYFRLLHRKMMNSSGGSGITKVFEILENQWSFLQEISKDIEGGYLQMALQYCQQVRLHMHLWTIVLARMLKGPQKYDAMSSRELGKWMNRALQVIRPPILKGQRLVRTIQNALANSSDYMFDDAFALLGQLVDTKHVLVYTSGVWESQGIYIIGSQALVKNPQVIKMLLSAYIVSDTLRLEEIKYCYLLIVRTDAEFNWTGATLMPNFGDILYQDLELVPGQMRLISPGLDRLERHRKWLEKINVADMLLPGEMATEVTDDILDKYVRSGRDNSNSNSNRNSNRNSDSNSNRNSNSNNNRNSTGHQSSKSSGSNRNSNSNNNRNSTGHQSSKSSGSNAGHSNRFSGSSANGGDDSTHGERGDRSKGERTLDDELDKINDTVSDFDALRPNLAPFERKLDKMNNPPKSTAARRALIANSADGSSKRDSVKPPAPARICELTRAHAPEVHKEWTLLKQSIVSMLDALTQIPDMLRTLHIDVHERAFYEALTTRVASPGGGAARHADGYESPGSRYNSIDSLSQPGLDTMACRGANCDLVEQVQESFAFVWNNASRGARFLDLKAERYVQLALMHMCVGWCGFITEDCMANEKRTFRWAVQALESTMRVCKDNTIQVLDREDWQLMKTQVAGCLTLMISHFDILGARNEELKIKELQKEREELKNADIPNVLLSLDSIGANLRTQIMQRQRVGHSQQVDQTRDEYLAEDGRIGHVLEVTARPEDKTLRLLAASKSNITIRWQLGRYIGGGAFGAVYVGYNLDTGDLMAVKEIRFPVRPPDRVAGIANANNANRGAGDDAQGGDQDNFGANIVREMEIMSMMQHENIVTYYGIEVHRDKVYLFMDLCTKGSLAQLIKDQGRLDEETVQLYVTQMLRGIQYLHQAGICHRDIKSDNTLLDENMNIKLVDFGAARVLNQQSAAAATRKTRVVMEGGKMSLAGTPMYMAPEVIAGSNGGATGGVSGGGGGVATRHEFRPGKFGAQDIWSLGCCVVEMVTGHPPWAHLDNEWAIMYHVVSGDPPLPGSSEVSSGCMRFLKRCLNRQPADRPGAAELLQDEWLADTLKSLERVVPHNQQQPSRFVSEPTDGMSSLGFLPSWAADQTQTDDMLYAHRANNPMDPMLGVNSRDDAHMHSYSSVGSVGSASNPVNRSRAPSINRKNISGDLRFMPLGADATNSEAMFSLIDHRSIGGSLSSGDRSPGSTGVGLHGTLAGLRVPMSTIGVSPLVRTPGSPGSTHSLHAAWPYNKDAVTGLGSTGTSSHGNSINISTLASAQTAVPPLVPSTSTGLMPWYPLSTSGIGAGSATTAVAPNDSLRSAGLELAAIYSSPSAIYQAISGASGGGSSSNAVPPSRLQNAMIMDSPVDSVATPSELYQFSADSVDASIPISSPGGNADADSNNMPAQESFPLGTAETDVSASALSSDEIQDLSETTRSVVTAMLSMPLEGVDVAGVAGWLGEGNTPMELLDAEEIKETVETTSHIVARQREQQIRRQQVIRSQLNRQKSQDDPSKNKEASGSEYRSSLGMSGSQTIRKGVVVEQRIEPPAVFPLPPDDTEDEEYEYEEEAEDEYESDVE